MYYENNTKISILLPTLGERSKEIEKLFISLTKQSYSNFELIVVVQDNFSKVNEICEKYANIFEIKNIQSCKKGISVARNVGLNFINGDIVMLSDDDAWYPSDALERVVTFFAEKPEADILLTQIYDPIRGIYYKDYGKTSKKLRCIFDLLSKSSIEIAFRYSNVNIRFDEMFGLGAIFVAGEENDFLIQCYRKNANIYYLPVITVYHPKKIAKTTDEQIIAKGAFYSKNFGVFISVFVLIRDLLKKRQNNCRWFFYGYKKYSKRIY